MSLPARLVLVRVPPCSQVHDLDLNELTRTNMSVMVYKRGEISNISTLKGGHGNEHICLFVNFGGILFFIVK